jgi:hypothetical protein
MHILSREYKSLHYVEGPCVLPHAIPLRDCSVQQHEYHLSANQPSASLRSHLSSTKANSRLPPKTLFPANIDAPATFTFSNYGKILYLVSGLSWLIGRGKGAAVKSKLLLQVRIRRPAVSFILTVQQ